MPHATVPTLGTDELMALARAAELGTDCPACRPLCSAGWEALPAAAGTGSLERVGTLRRPEVDDPTVEEHHPGGTHGWSATAPIAPAFFPYNRCDVWQCQACRRAFLRYTEYGGYYQEERIRLLDAALLA